MIDADEFEPHPSAGRPVTAEAAARAADDLARDSLGLVPFTARPATVQSSVRPRAGGDPGETCRAENPAWMPADAGTNGVMGDGTPFLDPALSRIVRGEPSANPTVSPHAGEAAPSSHGVPDSGRNPPRPESGSPSAVASFDEAIARILPDVRSLEPRVEGHCLVALMAAALCARGAAALAGERPIDTLAAAGFSPGEMAEYGGDARRIARAVLVETPQ